MMFKSTGFVILKKKIRGKNQAFVESTQYVSSIKSPPNKKFKKKNTLKKKKKKPKQTIKKNYKENQRVINSI